MRPRSARATQSLTSSQEQSTKQLDSVQLAFNALARHTQDVSVYLDSRIRDLRSRTQTLARFHPRHTHTPHPRAGMRESREQL